MFTDLGGRLKGYCSDTARGKVVGDAPSPEQRRFLNAQIEIVHATIAMIKPGVRIGDVAARAAEMAKEFGYEEWFYFRGHGIGLRRTSRRASSRAATRSSSGT